ncbi:MAG: glycosyltransferase [Gaiellales bacterium]
MQSADGRPGRVRPAWNEAAHLGAVLDELAAALPQAEVLVVDDRSTDGTAEIARGRGAEVLSFGENRGLRAALEELRGRRSGGPALPGPGTGGQNP